MRGRGETGRKEASAGSTWEYKVDDDAGPLDDRGACTPAGGGGEAGCREYRRTYPAEPEEQIEPCGTFTSALVRKR